MAIRILQGHQHSLAQKEADPHINVVIDVIRAFTVAHYAFCSGVKEIYLVDTVEEAFALKQQHPDFLLAGEVNGLPIQGFDLDNSPVTFQSKNLQDKTIIQKTTNGVHATLHALDADYTLVTGFSNAKTTAKYIQGLQAHSPTLQNINLIASHPTGDDDLACAEYMKSIILDHDNITVEETIQRIEQSHVADKFFDNKNEHFSKEDISLCTVEMHELFVMVVKKKDGKPRIERLEL
ncbi:2-phosphosulfolactate phosphatase [Alkalihalobacterium bogoriense]|uniref:2-phosphosulfolactate phosphatase n=1 Tax=Alkalihalobacterium bogoriense TaxID=246272 RepID=UPI00047C993A|nr:2-phosphosulfolactate phosphatase [Alkalihalobacterium bogoriense]